MGYRNLRQCVIDLEQSGHLVRFEKEVDPHLEVAEIHRRVYRAGGPAIFFSNVKDCRFPLVSNLFGTLERARFLFRDTIQVVQRLVDLKVDAADFWKHPLSFLGVPRAALTTLPRTVSNGPVLAGQTTVEKLPQLRSWPLDGGAFITLPVVYTEDMAHPGLAKSNLGMYRVQMSGGRYQPNQEVGLHYQLHRGIGVHHAIAQRIGKPLRVNIFVGGSPAMSLAAVMPLPEGMSELGFAGALAGHRIRMIRQKSGLPIYAESDFCITGTVDPDHLLPEGPFGDHLGYYSLAHDFPVLKVEKVYHRKGAIWPFTVVGRPPQEDTVFGQLIHDLTGPAIPSVLSGVHAVHAVDAAGVHPLLLALGSERYVPYQKRTQPQELLTQAHAILGQGQLSLAKYLWIAAAEDDPGLNLQHISEFFQHVLKRVDWKRDLHFQTSTTIDTLDYSGTGFNEGSKLVIAAAGPPLRDLPTELPADFRLPAGFSDPHICLPGVLAIRGPKHSGEALVGENQVHSFCATYQPGDSINRFPLVVVADESEPLARTLRNFLWVTFTRSNPATDIYGVDSFTEHKHWGCRGTLVIDARIKSHHAPPLEEDPMVNRRVDAWATEGGPLSRYL
jgi:4-hydroxy-3-polyprenylbenzoate decarboxylase